jgi:hypothetical protein
LGRQVSVLESDCVIDEISAYEQGYDCEYLLRERERERERVCKYKSIANGYREDLLTVNYFFLIV